MSKNTTKFFIFLIVLAIVIPIGLLTITALTQFVAYFQQGADPASIFHGHELVIPSPDEARWLPDTFTENVRISRSQREELISGYFRAWDAVSRAHATGDPTDLPTYWAGDALEQIRASIDPDVEIIQVHEQHRLQLTFFSDDGSVATLNDIGFRLIQTRDGVTIESTVNASVVMTLDNGFWRIRLITLSYH